MPAGLTAQLGPVAPARRSWRCCKQRLLERCAIAYTRRAGDQILLAAARAFAQDAVPLRDEFIRREMPETFIDDLNRLIGDFHTAINERNQSTGARVSATAATDEAIEQAMNAARELNSIVQIKFRGNRAVLAEWASARHIERRSHRPKVAPPSSATPPSIASETPESKT